MGLLLMFRLTNNLAESDFFIQLKGKHSGQPLKTHIPNSIGIACNPQLLDAGFFFYVVQYLFMEGRFLPYIKGSVIPYIRQEDIKKVISSHFMTDI